MREISLKGYCSGACKVAAYRDKTDKTSVTQELQNKENVTTKLQSVTKSYKTVTNGYKSVTPKLQKSLESYEKETVCKHGAMKVLCKFGCQES